MVSSHKRTGKTVKFLALIILFDQFSGNLESTFRVFADGFPPSAEELSKTTAGISIRQTMPQQTV